MKKLLKLIICTFLAASLQEHIIALGTVDARIDMNEPIDVKDLAVEKITKINDAAKLQLQWEQANNVNYTVQDYQNGIDALEQKIDKTPSDYELINRYEQLKEIKQLKALGPTLSDEQAAQQILDSRIDTINNSIEFKDIEPQTQASEILLDTTEISLNDITQQGIQDLVSGKDPKKITADTLKYIFEAENLSPQEQVKTQEFVTTISSDWTFTRAIESFTEWIAQIQDFINSLRGIPTRAQMFDENIRTNFAEVNQLQKRLTDIRKDYDDLTWDTYGIATTRHAKDIASLMHKDMGKIKDAQSKLAQSIQDFEATKLTNANLAEVLKNYPDAIFDQKI